jgi:hypothetical protein
MHLNSFAQSGTFKNLKFGTTEILVSYGPSPLWSEQSTLIIVVIIILLLSFVIHNHQTILKSLVLVETLIKGTFDLPHPLLFFIFLF